MDKHEKRARALKAMGNNCSVSLYKTFMEDKRLDGDIPEPRSIDGKCGALLTAIKILRETGHEDKVSEFENKFLELFKYNKCMDLMKYEHRCSDYVGMCARMLDEILGE